MAVASNRSAAQHATALRAPAEDPAQVPEFTSVRFSTLSVVGRVNDAIAEAMKKTEPR